MIATSNLSKLFRQRVALHDVSFEVPRGEVFGFVGPNGAGKTTTMRILAGLLQPTGGTAFIDGIDVIAHPGQAQERVGYMPDFFGVYDQLTVGEYLDFYAACYRQPRARREKVAADLLELVGLTDRREQAVNTLSRGLKQRLCLARALVHDPSVLLLDEPASGLDPRARVEMREILRELRGMGKTILISSHILPELTELCTMVGIIDQGTMRATGSVHDVVHRLQQGRVLRIEVVGVREEALAALQAIPGVQEAVMVDGAIEARYQGDARAAAEILAQLVRAGIAVSSFAEADGGLEDAFLRLTAEPKSA